MSNQDIINIKNIDLAAFRSFCGRYPYIILSEKPSIYKDYTCVTFVNHNCNSFVYAWFKSFKINYLSEDKA